MTETSTQTQQAGTPLALPASAQQLPTDSTMATAPLATSPTNITRPALPLPQGKRPHEEPTGQAEPKQSRTAQSSAAVSRGQQEEQPHSKIRIQAVTITTKKGDTITTASCEDEQEAEVERMLQEPFLYDNEGLDSKKVQQGMKKEAQSMKGQGVLTEINYNDVPDEYKGKIIESRWVNKPKQDEVRCRIVAKGFLETIQDLDNIYASTPIFGILRILLTMALHKQWTIQAGDVSTAFLHAPAATDNLYMWPPPELYPSGHNSTTVWKLNKAIYGLRSSPKSWQDHFAQVLQQLGPTRLTSEPNVYRNKEQTMFVMVYVDDLLFLGQPKRSTRPSRKYKSTYSYDQQAHSELGKQSNSLEETSTTTETILNSVSSQSTLQHSWKKQKWKQAIRQQLQGRQPWNNQQMTKHPWTNKNTQTTEEQ